MKLLRTLTATLLSSSSISLSVSASPLIPSDSRSVSVISQETTILEKRADISGVNVWYSRHPNGMARVNKVAGLSVGINLAEAMSSHEPNFATDSLWVGLQSATSLSMHFFASDTMKGVDVRAKYVHFKKVSAGIAGALAIGASFEVPEELIPVVINAITAYFEHNTIAITVTEVSDAHNIGGPIEQVQNPGANAKGALQCRAYDLSSLFHHSVKWDPHSPLYSMKLDC